SNFGECAFLCAPGVNVLSTMPTYKVPKGGTLHYGLMSGTSMAAPCVAGVAGLVRSKHPEWDRTQVAEALKQSARDLGSPGQDCLYGYGRVDALKAVSL
ncbi:MAG: S8 family peptidase, partial [Bacteroidota bacterium]